MLEESEYLKKILDEPHICLVDSLFTKVNCPQCCAEKIINDTHKVLTEGVRELKLKFPRKVDFNIV